MCSHPLTEQLAVELRKTWPATTTSALAGVAPMLTAAAALRRRPRIVDARRPGRRERCGLVAVVTAVAVMSITLLYSRGVSDKSTIERAAQEPHNCGQSQPDGGR